MQTVYYRYGDSIKFNNDCAAALGFFDGVHIGHRALIAELVRSSHEKGLTPCVLTFTDSVRNSRKEQTILYNLEDKIEIFKDLGVERTIVCDFDSLSELSPEEFTSKVLIEALSIRLTVVGYNFRFGHGQSGNSELLSELMAKKGREGIILDEELLGKMRVSATEIKKLISNKDIECAAKMLGSPYFIKGVVEHGLGLGRSFGFPTVNTPVRSTSPLPTGVYRTAVKIGEKLYTGVTNVGFCPTVGERELHAETLIADFSGDLYGDELVIFFLGYLRDERRFDTVEELRDQVFKDKQKAIKENGELTWQAIGLS